VAKTDHITGILDGNLRHTAQEVPDIIKSFIFASSQDAWQPLCISAWFTRW
jgi:hypothetical protein